LPRTYFDPLWKGCATFLVMFYRTFINLYPANVEDMVSSL